MAENVRISKNIYEGITVTNIFFYYIDELVSLQGKAWTGKERQNDSITVHAPPKGVNI
jgi:hypothetical protein